jgi:hypothetical protein
MVLDGNGAWSYGLRVVLVALASACGPDGGTGEAASEASGSAEGTFAAEDDPSAEDDHAAADVDDAATDDSPPDPGIDPIGSDGKVDCALLPDVGPSISPTDVNALGFPVACSPRGSGDGAYTCCSTDPATTGGALPSFAGREIEGGEPPVFAGANNDLSTWGQCVRVQDIPPTLALLEPEAEGCPIPCDPRWNDRDVAAVCGTGRQCCQAQELGPRDCVLPEGEDLYRPVTGADIPALTNWTAASHDTHQDPNGIGCMTVTGDDQDAFASCVQHLGVADRRGFCLALEPGVECPHAAPTYIDACEERNAQ